ncbi:MAG: hypothetical protein GY727_13285 [Gammaproteobacteria bacterium]|nr:hypothetical protein [Gammaproteobacteria bacterium]MCP4088258.1 hypothetical protein [Gammaproteobacteria bacterium]MCP4276431.1 hypothetical protein [Gammaproteobacteria bacterium]MCP4831078.1 hypothetical protein [Gammaproteobacteria bacterium]MCP4929346.1 hypothetical protein [Gammaproteobacteria bacterium]
MKCLYYLAPTLHHTHQISDDLHDAGVNEWFMHVVSKDEAGLKREKLHSSNYLETLDLLRGGFIGAIIGFAGGLIGIGLLMYTQFFGPDIPVFIYLLLVVVAILMGAWIGGLSGIGAKSQKLRHWQGEIDAGKYLILIYAHKGQGEAIKSMMLSRHPEAQHVATDRHFMNPLAVVRRKQNAQETTVAF